MKNFVAIILIGAGTYFVANLFVEPEIALSPVEKPTAFSTTTQKFATSTEMQKPATTTLATTTKNSTPTKTASQQKPKPTVPKPESPVSQPPQTPTTQTDWDKINLEARASTVNILCVSASGGLFNPISGSGIIIDKRGVILTNAHIAQYFLLKDYLQKDFLTCSIRQGSPASPKYTARLLYISPTWVTEHVNDIVAQEPLGTGEYDYALLLITGSTDPTISKPSEFPAVTPQFTELIEPIGQSALITSYPAGFLGGTSIQTGLFLTSAPVTIKNRWTFSSETIDLISLGGPVSAQAGSSGGPVFDKSGRLIGLVVTSTVTSETSTRDLRAITLPYINRTLNVETEASLNEILAGNLEVTADSFNTNIAPGLTQLLTDKLNKATTN